MTVPDPTAPTAEDVIRSAAGAALPRSMQPVGVSLREPAEMGGAITGYGQQIVDAITPAVVAAIRGMSVQQQAELVGGEVERVGYDAHDGTGWHRRLRLVGPWQETP